MLRGGRVFTGGGNIISIYLNDFDNQYHKKMYESHIRLNSAGDSLEEMSRIASC